MTKRDLYLNRSACQIKLSTHDPEPGRMGRDDWISSQSYLNPNLTTRVELIYAGREQSWFKNISLF